MTPQILAENDLVSTECGLDQGVHKSGNNLNYLKEAKSEQDFYLKEIDLLHDYGTESLEQLKFEKSCDFLLAQWLKHQRKLAKIIYQNCTLNDMEWVALSLKNPEFQATVNEFADAMRVYGYKEAGRQTQAIVFILPEDITVNGRTVVLKLPYCSNIMSGINKGLNISIVGEAIGLYHLDQVGVSDYFQKPAFIDNKKYHGLALATYFFTGSRIQDDEILNDITCLTKQKINAEQIPVLIKDYYLLHKAQTVSLWDSGGWFNTIIDSDGNLKILDFDPFHENAIEYQHQLFNSQPLSGAIFNIIKDLLYCVEHPFLDGFLHPNVNKDSSAASFYNYRYELLVNALKEFLSAEQISEEEFNNSINYLIELSRDTETRKKFRGGALSLSSSGLNKAGIDYLEELKLSVFYG